MSWSTRSGFEDPLEEREHLQRRDARRFRRERAAVLAGDAALAVKLVDNVRTTKQGES